MIGRNNKVLLHAYKKTGQHWLMFVLANYHKILMEDIEKPLEWGKVENFGRRGKGYTSKEWDGITRAITFDDFPMEFPTMLRSEMNWNGNLIHHESFDKVIYLWRNPFDVLLSFYYYAEKEKLRENLIKTGTFESSNPLTISMDYYLLWQYIKERLPLYIKHLNEGYHHADVILKYEALRENPNLFKDAFLLFYDDIDEEAFQKALKFGGFEQVHKINPHHARKGKVGQYKEVMTAQMILYIKRKCKHDLKKEILEELEIEEY